MRAYIAGPMRGYPEFNRSAFVAGTKTLRALGYEVFSPVEYSEKNGFDFTGTSGKQADAEDSGFPLREALAADLAWICQHADLVVVLPGWEKSLGATAEVATAEALGIPVKSFMECAVSREESSHGSC